MKGGPIRRHVDEIRGLLAEGRPEPSILADLLAHAASTTPAYEPYAGCDLGAFPVLGRQELKGRPDAFRSRAFRTADLHERRTSGSTGVPLTIVQDPGKRRRAIADLIVFNEAAGQRVGDRLLWLHSARLFPQGRTRRLRQNIIPFDHIGLDEQRMAEVIGILGKERVNAVLSVPSTLAALARYLERSARGDEGFGLRVVIASGESLDPETKARIAVAFGCPVVDRYANEENGVLASSLPHDERAHLNVASYLVELLEVDFGRAGGPGHAGEGRGDRPLQPGHAPHPLRHGRPGRRLGCRRGWPPHALPHRGSPGRHHPDPSGGPRLGADGLGVRGEAGPVA